MTTTVTSATRASAYHWNWLIKRQVAHGAYTYAFLTLSRMLRAGVQLDNYTFPIALKACTLHHPLSSSSSSSTTTKESSLLLRQGQQIHALLIFLGFQWDVYSANALINMYCGHGHLPAASQAFEEMTQRSTVSWNSIIAGFILNDLPHASISYFSRMMTLLPSEEHPDSVTMCTVLHAYARIGGVPAHRGGRAVHAYIVRRGTQIATISKRPFVENALINMYLESSCLFSAEKVFQGMPMYMRDIVTWTTMISGYMGYKLKHLALATFRSMIRQERKEDLDPVTLATVMPALMSLRQGKEMHCFAVKCGYDCSNAFVATSLLHMYAEFGTIEYAAKQFDRIQKRNVVAWTAMITAYAKHGRSEDSLRLFSEMRKQTSVTPNHLTFMGVLTACTHAGLVEQSQYYFNCMTQEYGLTPDMYHYTAMVDVLGRAGRLREALEFIKAMPVEPSAPVWGSLLSCCGIHQEVKLGREVANIVIGMEPENPGNFVLLSNMLAQDRRWDDASVVRETMKFCGLKKVPGYSSVHVHQANH